MGDRVRFALTGPAECGPEQGWRAFLRTNLGRAAVLRAETIAAVEEGKPPTLASWRDLPLTWRDGAWRIELPVAEVGWFEAKAYAVDPDGWQHWPAGGNVGLSVQPAHCRTGNTIYCAFTRMFGRGQEARTTTPSPLEEQLAELDRQGFTVIPASGTFRDLGRALPHIFDTLGCRILHLLPVHPTPTVFARFGRFGSPYACEDLLAVDPALIEFDRRTTGLDQFRELARGVHERGGRLFLDIVINHTGWGSTLWENRPDWFVRNPDGTFHSPGAWGNTWEDLVELRHDHPELRRYIADALLEWCRRGVDGFRCDAGYMVPVDVWRYIVARVRQEFPDTVFLLEGLGGSWEATETLLTRGNLQWAYFELFQNYSGGEVARYLDYALERSRHSGLYVHYSETHDNPRLAAKGRAWSLLRNRLCALASVSGGFGFTCGVEWLAAEKIDVHSRRGLSWGNEDHLLPELGRLNRLLAGHPAFFDGARITRLSGEDAPVLALLRVSAGGEDAVLALVNTDVAAAQTAVVPVAPLREAGLLGPEKEPPSWVDLLGQDAPEAPAPTGDSLEIPLAGGAAFCLAARAEPRGLAGAAYRRRKAREAFALQALSRLLPVESLAALDLGGLAAWVERDPADFLAAVARAGEMFPDQSAETRQSGSSACPTAKQPAESRRDPAAEVAARLKPEAAAYPAVIRWQTPDERRVVPWPPGHWLLIEHDAPFRATLRPGNGGRAEHAESLPVADGHVAAFWPGADWGGTEARLELECYGEGPDRAGGRLRCLRPNPGAPPPEAALPERVLLTNGRGGMARLAVDFGAITSKYDCLLGANLHPRVPVDRHIFVKRARVWVDADGFLSPLNRDNLAAFSAGPPAHWRFRAHAGDGRTAEIEIRAEMLPDRNTTVLRFHRPQRHGGGGTRDLPPEADVRLTVRLDLEDRNFHQETKHNPAADAHFREHVRPLDDAVGFAFRPAPERSLRVVCDAGRYHPQPEWCDHIPHPVEQSRGQEGSGDAYSPGWFEIPMPGGATVTLTMEVPEAAGGAKDQKTEGRAKNASAERPAPLAAATVGTEDPFAAALAAACRAFLARRDDGWTVIAGYPWFLDWGRDTLICARGLLAAGWRREVRALLDVFGRFEENGTLPNAIHGEDAANRDTSDAPLWYGVVAEELAAEQDDPAAFYRAPVAPGGRALGEVLRAIAVGYLRGTPNGIRVDPESGLVWSPPHFTWMDTNHPAGTPREGYPIEIQALWIRLLRQLARIGAAPLAEPWETVADRARAAMERLFWLDGPGWFADVLLAPAGRAATDAQPQDALRSNALLPVALGLIAGERARRTVTAARRWLVVPGALRSLAPLRVNPPLPVHAADGRLLNDPEHPYWGRYEGDEDTRRKPAYHNGTAWTWTFPVFCEALARAWDFAPPAVAAARAFLGGMDRLLAEGCAGQLPEIVDGDAPHLQRGCDAQAWGATEALRVWRLLGEKTGPSGRG